MQESWDRVYCAKGGNRIKLVTKDYSLEEIEERSHKLADILGRLTGLLERAESIRSTAAVV